MKKIWLVLGLCLSMNSYSFDAIETAKKYIGKLIASQVTSQQKKVLEKAVRARLNSIKDHTQAVLDGEDCTDHLAIIKKDVNTLWNSYEKAKVNQPAVKMVAKTLDTFAPSTVAKYKKVQEMVNGDPAKIDYNFINDRASRMAEHYNDIFKK